ncbi:hypothetical protein FPZ24_10790 [Sphingomonas panacisoli]|uniref:Uncharacterized protein n=1 Tax=Sphingomonas panacisoli TaxID=1813879 RepID=A0A5B8LK36_9SPHN|nr:hypothetical protein [Sphingomonas panacisoli]QDZ07912.1 hypothetical protein FPZ24_10790 [Sphingomonas panacisoli]
MAVRLCAVLLLAGAAIVTPALADDDIPPVVGGKTYVQHLISTAMARHPGVLSIVVEGPRDAGKEVLVLGSTLGASRVFGKVDAPDTTLGGAVSPDGKRFVVREPFASNSGHRLGTMAISFAYRRGSPTKNLVAIADAISREVARVTLSTKNAVDPYPYDASYGTRTYAQALTERTILRHPELLVMMIHATPPGKPKNVIIGSNIGRIGKIADEDDLRVIDQGSTNLEIGGDNDRFETELPLLDATGKRIGALGLVFNYRDGDDKEAIHRKGLSIRDEVAKAIANNAALFRPSR